MVTVIRAAIACALFVSLTLYAARAIPSLRGGYACDLDCFIGSSTYLRAGQNPYEYTVTLPGHPPSPNLNAPLSLVLLWPLAGLSVVSVFPAWAIASLVAYSATLALPLRGRRPSFIVILWALALPGLWYTLQAGQVYTFLALLVAGALVLAVRHPALAGVCLGLLIALKPNFGLLALVLFAAGHRRLAASSLVAAGLLALIPAALFGPQIYRHWLSAGIRYSNPFWGNGSLGSLASRLNIPALPLVAALVLGTLYRVHRAHPDPEGALLAGLCLSLLAAPAAWIGYAVLLVPPLARRPLGVPAALLAVPTTFMLLPDWLFRWTNPGILFCVAMLWVLARTLLPDGVQSVQVRLHSADVRRV